MQISESLIGKNQNYINFWTAESSYNDMEAFVSKYIAVIDNEFGTSYDHSSIFQREFDYEKECLNSR